MDVFTFDEQQLVAIFNADTREGTISALEKMSAQLEEDEVDLRKMTASSLTKLRVMTDAEFAELDLMPDFVA